MVSGPSAGRIERGSLKKTTKTRKSWDDLGILMTTKVSMPKKKGGNNTERSFSAAFEANKNKREVPQGPNKGNNWHRKQHWTGQAHTYRCAGRSKVRYQMLSVVVVAACCVCVVQLSRSTSAYAFALALALSVALHDRSTLHGTCSNRQ